MAMASTGQSVACPLQDDASSGSYPSPPAHCMEVREPYTMSSLSSAWVVSPSVNHSPWLPSTFLLTPILQPSNGSWGLVVSMDGGNMRSVVGLTLGGVPDLVRRDDADDEIADRRRFRSHR